MVFNYWIMLCILEQENQTESETSPLHTRWLWPALHPYPLTVPARASQDFQTVCLSQPGLSTGRSEVQGFTSLGIGSQGMTNGNWWLNPQLPYLTHANLYRFPEFPVVSHWITHTVFTSGSSLSSCSPTCVF